MSKGTTLTERAVNILGTADAYEKVRRTFEVADAWAAGKIAEIGATPPPDRPARPTRPELAPPNQMPKRSTGVKGRIALLHAIAHIEFNAIDLGWDIVARFADAGLPRAFFDDWVQVARDEAEHFQMLADLLTENGAAYGDLPAHDGLWEAATKTRHDVLARLALVPMVLEARGLDTTPKTVEKLRNDGEAAIADAFENIAAEEIPHVAAGVRWFEHVCEKRGQEPVVTFRALIAELYPADLKPPFNVAARDAAGMVRGYYEAV